MSAHVDARVSPRVSVVMPTKNAEPFVRAAIASVLQERSLPIELIVVEDGSTDGTVAIIESISDPRVKMVRGPQTGVSASFNAGYASAVGDVLMICDADDLYVPERIARQYAWLNENPDADAVCGRFGTIDSNSAPVVDLAIQYPSEENISSELADGVVRTHLCTYAIRRRALERVGLQREYFKTGQDIDLQLRLGEKCRVVFLPQQFYLYRLHARSITHTQAANSRMYFESAAREFQRQRRKLGADSLELGTPPEPPRAATPATSADAHVFGFREGAVWRALNEGQRGRAILESMRTLALHPGCTRAWSMTLKIVWKIATRALRATIATADKR